VLRLLSEGDGAGWRDGLKNFFCLRCIFCLQGTQGFPNVHPVQATKRSRYLVTVDLGQHLWNRVDQKAHSEQRTRANVCKLIISSALSQCPTSDTKTLSRGTKP
jgi:hypothetical protein